MAANMPQNITNETVEQFTAELKVLLAKYNVEIGVDVHGDTHGLTYDFVVCDTGGWKEYPISNNNYIGAKDI